MGLPQFHTANVVAFNIVVLVLAGLVIFTYGFDVAAFVEEGRFTNASGEVQAEMILSTFLMALSLAAIILTLIHFRYMHHVLGGWVVTMNFVLSTVMIITYSMAVDVVTNHQGGEESNPGVHGGLVLSGIMLALGCIGFILGCVRASYHASYEMEGGGIMSEIGMAAMM